MRLFSFGATLLLGLSAGANPSGDPETIRIVSSFPRSGSTARQTDRIVQAVRLAFEEAGWEAGGYRLVLEDWDDSAPGKRAWSDERERANACRAADDPEVMAYIGPYHSAAAEVSRPILSDAGVLMISPTNTAPALTRNLDEGSKRNYCRVVPADDLQGHWAAEWTAETAVRTIYLLDSGDDYGRSIADRFAIRAEERNLRIVGRETIRHEVEWLAGLPQRLEEANPDLLYLAVSSPATAGGLVRLTADRCPRLQFLAPESCLEKTFLEAAGLENAEGRCRITMIGLAPERWTGAAREFADRFALRYGVDPDAYSLYAYEAAKAVIESIRRAGRKDRDAIRKACLSLRDFEGVLGRWFFDERGDIDVATLIGFLVRERSFEFARRLGTADPIR